MKRSAKKNRAFCPASSLWFRLSAIAAEVARVHLSAFALPWLVGSRLAAVAAEIAGIHGPAAARP